MQLGGGKTNGVSPMKQTLDKYAIKEDFDADEEMKREIEKLKT